MKDWLKKQSVRNALAGIISGLCNGLFGAGGGAVAVLALERLCGLEPPKAHATAISIMLPLTAAGAAVYACSGGVDWHALIFVAPGLIAGSLIGARLTGKLNSNTLSRVFSLVMFAAGAWMLL